MRDLRIVFMGTPQFAVGVLKKLINENCNVVGVITAPDRPAGRGRKVSQSAVKEYAISRNIPLLQPTNLKDDAFLEELKALDANLQIVVAFRMLPKVVWEMPEFGTFNLHASLLPQYRGAAPINWAIINGEKETGVTTFFIDEKIDTGAIIASEKVKIKKDETFETLHDTLMEVGSDLVIKTVQLIEKDKATPKLQPKSEVFKEAPKLTSENTRIQWKTTLAHIDCFIRGLSPYPTAWTLLKNGEDDPQKVKIFATTIIKDEHNFENGVIITSKKEIKVAVEDGYVFIEELQLPGKKKMKAHELLNGLQFKKEAHFV
ncbi:methionyl-tRNA formyltransferase [Aureisphaera sp. CAU 1614]|uniref:Methionyl-tRNA formyltransferase n=1 Tax=Halomarinibacterium sedimenti TaxID=2857106 RepID=A0A9X1FNK7_9FLAO|nr:methionyl-tRNA formyltransferase [Halomarinibacterium sedimenti]MBW2937508.1 methionyl-tRNA formyltransferase [Halomarinibacterium sedimenti]